MPVNIRLPDRLVEQARRAARTERRSVPEQVAHWALIGRLAEDNPDLPYSVIRDILAADRERSVEVYRFG